MRCLAGRGPCFESSAGRSDRETQTVWWQLLNIMRANMPGSNLSQTEDCPKIAHSIVETPTNGWPWHGTAIPIGGHAPSNIGIIRMPYAA